MNIKGVEVNKELVLSTGHVTEKECNNDAFFNYSNDECNVRFLVHHVLDFITEKDLVSEYPNLHQLLKMAIDLECKWLLLDSDGNVHPDLVVFEW